MGSYTLAVSERESAMIAAALIELSHHELFDGTDEAETLGNLSVRLMDEMKQQGMQPDCDTSLMPYFELHAKWHDRRHKGGKS